jgi:hypothetical protein
VEKPVIYCLNDNKESLENLENELSAQQDGEQTEEAAYGKTPDDAKAHFQISDGVYSQSRRQWKIQGLRRRE